jgi:hypothetical protein
MLIQVDVDSTLYDANKLFYEVGREEFGIDWPKKYYYWFGPEDIGTDLATLKNVFRKCHSRDYVLKQKPYKGAVEVLAQIAQDYDDVEIAFVSDRNEAQTAALQDWLDQEGFLVNGDEYVAATKDKREWMREQRPDIVIDDRIRTILMARFELDAYVTTLEHPHNMNLKGEVNGVYVVKDWTEMGVVLNKEVIPKLQTKVKV